MWNYDEFVTINYFDAPLMKVARAIYNVDVEAIIDQASNIRL